jgi:F-type H+-transporting ATPase subunit b
VKRRIALLVSLSVLLFAFGAFAQEHEAQPKKEPAAASTENKGEQGKGSHASGKKAGDPYGAQAGEESNEGHDENREFKESPSVKWFAGRIGLSPKSAYWVSVVINFAVILIGIIWAMKAGLPGVFRSRSEAIQRQMEEARKASAEANARLSDIESRLARMDAEISAMRSQADSAARSEEDRLRAATEDERKKIVETAEQEIAAASGSARRELRQYAAELAVSLAAQRIKVDPSADRALVSEFARHLSGNGGGRS